MGTWNREIRFRFGGWSLVAVAASLMLLGWIVLLGTKARKEPARCASGFVSQGARCCAPGQESINGQCSGRPTSCPSGFQFIQSPVPGCVIKNKKLRISGGSLTLGPTDWDSADVMEKSVVAVRSFYLDSSEVTAHRYAACIKAGLCKPLTTLDEPGLPLTNVSLGTASDFCAFSGGHLPTPAQWVFAASGSETRRFPWGPHGLVCRRASFGLTDGPCAVGGTTPELAGARPDGRTPLGLEDMAGNVSEIVQETAGQTSLMGGSFRSKTARELKVWSSQGFRIGSDVGFRCAYPVRYPTNHESSASP